jgi:hypothetical protein
MNNLRLQRGIKLVKRLPRDLFIHSRRPSKGAGIGVFEQRSNCGLVP